MSSIGSMLGPETLLDAATGARLLARGIDPARAALDAPEALQALHAADIEAGAQWVTSATFSATAPDAVREAIAVAASFRLPVLASLGPFGTTAELRGRAEQCLAEGAEMVSLETFTEDGALVDALSALRGLPVLASYCPLGGATHAPERFVLAGASAIGVNCGDGLDALVDASIALLRFGLPVVLRPSAGLPKDDGDYPLGTREFASGLRRAWTAGVHAAGGCCGVTPAHLRAASER